MLRHRLACAAMSSAAEQMAKPCAVSLRLLFCGDEAAFPDGLKFTRQCLEQHCDIQVDALPFQDASENIHKYDMCVVRMMKLDAGLIRRAERLKLICQFGVGLEGVDIPAATKAGIRVARIPSAATGNAFSCAEHAIYLMLALLRDQKAMEQAVLDRRLGAPTGRTLFGKTVFIVGYGNIGRELAMRLRGFDVRVLASRRSWTSKTADVQNGSMTANSHRVFQYLNENDDLLVDEKGGEESLYEFAARADIVVLCCQLTSETAGMVNERFVASLQKGTIVVNVARGGLLDYNAVSDGLESGQIGGLGMDVAWYEPFDPQDPIVQHPKVIFTPHVAGVTEVSYRNMAKIIADSAIELLNGRDYSGLEVVN